MKNMNKDVDTKDKILSLIRDNQDKIKAYGVKKIGLFGSFVRNMQGPTSDIDFLIEFEEDKKTFDNFINLSFLLEEVLKRRVEVVTSESLSPYLAPYILKEVEYVSFSS
jgi:predicted nucleotidyltransferase